MTTETPNQVEAQERGGLDVHADALVSDFYLIAGNQQQARDYYGAKGLRYDPRRVFHAAHCMLGLPRGLTVRLGGTYLYRNDWREMEEMIQSCGFIVEHGHY